MTKEIVPGTVVGDYRIVQVLGRGGTATVYLAVDAQDRERALKVYRNLKDPARFWREVQAVMGLHHPGLVEIHGFGWDPLPHLVMERVLGVTLKAWLRGSPEDAERRRILTDVLAAAVYAHEHQVVHRDLKPDNVFVRVDGRASVGDFGTAMGLDAARLTTTGEVQGTPGYVSPEQLRGERATPASDQYALGVLAFETLTGRAPFAADSPVAAMYLQLSAKVPSLLEVRDDLPVALDTCVQRMMSPTPAARFASVAEAALAFRQAWP